jgi:tetratricopeptide (TPR) repeat protein
LTVSVSILTDFVRRLLTSGPDEIGLFSIAVQGLFTVGATSTFTSAGGQGIQSLLSRLGIEDGHRPAVRLWASVTLFAIVFCAWKFLPDRRAEHYNDIAFRQTYSDPDAARENYGKAISLNPRIPQAHYNLGTLYENAYEYDRAAAEYRRAIVVDPNHVIAYSNLSRLLLMGNDPPWSAPSRR